MLNVIATRHTIYLWHIGYTYERFVKKDHNKYATMIQQLKRVMNIL